MDVYNPCSWHFSCWSRSINQLLPTQSQFSDEFNWSPQMAELFEPSFSYLAVYYPFSGWCQTCYFTQKVCMRAKKRCLQEQMKNYLLTVPSCKSAVNELLAGKNISKTEQADLRRALCNFLLNGSKEWGSTSLNSNALFVIWAQPLGRQAWISSKKHVCLWHCWLFHFVLSTSGSESRHLPRKKRLPNTSTKLFLPSDGRLVEASHSEIIRIPNLTQKTLISHLGRNQGHCLVTVRRLDHSATTLCGWCAWCPFPQRSVD